MTRILLIAMSVCVLAILAVSYSLDRYERSDSTRHSRAVAEMAESWHGDVDFSPTYAALDPALVNQASDAAPDFSSTDQYWGLPEGEGRELVADTCGACHSLQLVMQQRRSAARWEQIVGQMVRLQGMPAPTPEDRAAIVAYLAQHYGEGAP